MIFLKGVSMRLFLSIYFFFFLLFGLLGAEDAKSDRTAFAEVLKNAHISQTDVKNVSNLEKMEFGDENQISYDPVSGRIVGLKLHLTEFNDLSLISSLTGLKVLMRLCQVAQVCRIESKCALTMSS